MSLHGQGAKRFSAPDGDWWTVRALPASASPPRCESLVFESEIAIRRVTNFPPNWMDLSPEELFALSWRR